MHQISKNIKVTLMKTLQSTTLISKILLLWPIILSITLLYTS